MTNCILDGTTLSWVLRFEEEETSSISVHKWINAAASANVDETVWNKELTRIFLTVRVNNCEKRDIETSANNLATVTFDDGTNELTVWIYKVSALYKANECWESPWLLEVELIISDA